MAKNDERMASAEIINFPAAQPVLDVDLSQARLPSGALEQREGMRLDGVSGEDSMRPDPYGLQNVWIEGVRSDAKQYVAAALESAGLGLRTMPPSMAA